MTEFRAVVGWIARSGKRITITVVGFALVVAGLAGIVLPLLPGPLLIIAGFAVLATEYAWARRALDETKRRTRSATDRLRRRRRE